MVQAELIREALIDGAIGGAVLSLVAFLLSKFVRDAAGRTLLATVLFAAAGAYLGFAFQDSLLRGWVAIELLHIIAFGVLGLYGWRGSPYWLALAYALHPLWDVGLHYFGPGSSFAPLSYAIACMPFDWIVAAYIFIAYRWLRLANRQAPSHAR